MAVVGLGELIEGAARLAFDTSGAPDPALVVVDLDDSDLGLVDDVTEALDCGPTPVVVGVATKPVPPALYPVLSRLTLTLGGGPERYCAGTSEDLERVRSVVAGAPLAACTLAHVLNLASRATVIDGILVESTAYSMLLAGPEFCAWREQRSPRATVAGDAAVIVRRHGDVLEITLNRPERHNAFGTAVRDGLLAGLQVAELDPSVREVVVSGHGPSFCSGGDLDEFGSAPDVATAHLLRVGVSAGLALHRVRDRVRVVLHGACIGAGIEIPAFASRVEARADSSFVLPELQLGLIPGAGGTVSIASRIGRWRTAYMALTAYPIDVQTAIDWGLVDARA